MTDVKNIKIIGKIFINIKNNNFLSFKFILKLIFFINKKIKNKNGINIPICLSKNNNGYLNDLKYLIPLNQFFLNHIKL